MFQRISVMYEENSVECFSSSSWKIFKLFSRSSSIIFGVVFLSFFDVAFAQFSLQSPIVTPPSPNAYSLAKYADHPSATYSGIPEISLPIYELPTKTIKHGIYLSYNAQGFKVQEEASSVGLGWSLISSGVITRDVSGKDDFSVNGYHKVDPPPFSLDFILNYDPSPDIFRLSLNGQSLRFTFKYNPANPSNPTLFMLDQEPFRINYNSSNDWEVFDSKGIKYTFSAKEYSRREYDVNGSTWTTNFISSWYLTRIQSPTGELVEFIYFANPASIESNQETQNIVDVLLYHNPCNPNSTWPADQYKKTLTKSFSEQLMLKEISFPNGKILFTSNYRIDLKYEGSSIPQRYGVITILDNNGKYFKEVLLGYDYFDSGTGRADFLSKRLRLTDLKVRDQTKTLESFKFKYATLSLPDKDSYAKDYWGFYNGATTNTTPFGNREPNPSFSTAALLNEITLPTGGKVRYLFEANDYSNFDPSKIEETPMNSANGGKIGPGCRIAKVEHFSLMGVPIKSTAYSYTKNLNGNIVTSGKRMTGSKYSEVIQRTLPPSCQGGSGATIKTNELRSENYFSAGIGSSGYEIGYEVVTETYLDGSATNGKREFWFVNDPNLTAVFPGIPVNLNPLNGKPQRILTYKFENNQPSLIEEIVNQYDLINSSTISPIKVIPNYTTGQPMPVSYELRSNWIVNKKTSETKFEVGSGQQHIQETSFFFDNIAHKQLTREERINTRGETIRKFMSYPLDFGLGNPQIEEMNQKHLLDYPIEIVETLQGIGLDYVLSGKINLYKSGGQGLLDQVLILEAADPINSYDFKLSNKPLGVFPPNSQVSSFQPDSRYKSRINIDSYQDGQISQLRMNGGTPQSVIWDHGGQYIVLLAKNSALTDVYYTSFETARKGGWSFSGSPISSVDAKTGGMVYNLSQGPVSVNNPSASSGNPFKLSFWAKRISGSGAWSIVGGSLNLTSEWIFIERIITQSSFSLSGSDILIDELRLHPINALVTTFTYQPLVGITSQSDERNNIIYYNYDLHGRLLNSKNIDNSFLKIYEYGYATEN